ncbi:hypothetical protein LCGC14_2315690 [marine sediment metagenome]|uniref:Uncharacterized protein n=1 Tax=marine sediment metagenome TaxID=412755 RepID=A0A0F9CJE7_9ZZZZ
MAFETLLVISGNSVNIIFEPIIHSSQFSSCFHGKVLPVFVFSTPLHNFSHF